MLRRFVDSIDFLGHGVGRLRGSGRNHSRDHAGDFGRHGTAHYSSSGDVIDGPCGEVACSDR
jgi:hypothetical protein